VCVCVCVCACMCMHACMYVCMHVCICVHIYEHALYEPSARACPTSQTCTTNPKQTTYCRTCLPDTQSARAPQKTYTPRHERQVSVCTPRHERQVSVCTSTHRYLPLMQVHTDTCRSCLPDSQSARAPQPPAPHGPILSILKNKILKRHCPGT